MSGSAHAVRLPPVVEITFNPERSAREQVLAALGTYRSGYAWFAALTEDQYQQLANRLVELCGEADIGDGETLIRITMEELQNFCEVLIPLHDLNQALLDGLDLQHVLGRNDEERHMATYSQLTAARYERTPAIAAMDPTGKKFIVDLAPILEPRGYARAGALNFTALGCHGTATTSLRRVENLAQVPYVPVRAFLGNQKAVGEEVKAWHTKQAAGAATFGFLLGDNFYDSGLPTTNIPLVDSMFNEGYYKIYNSQETGIFSKTTTGLNIPYFGLLGNHDYNFHGHAALASDGGTYAQNMDRAIAQVDYGYRNPDKGWHMPYRYYVLTSAHADFFCIDTATLLFDKTQQEWLRNVYASRAGNGKWKFLMGHHGYVTFGNRGSGHHAEKDIKGLMKTGHTKASAKALSEQGVTSASEEQMAGSAALGLDGNVNKHVFTWCVSNSLHFHFNVVAHDHFSAAAMLTYDFPDGTYRRTYYVLAGGGGATLGGSSPDTLVALGPNCANLDLMESKWGFATFKVTDTTVELNYRLQKGSSWEDAWDDAKVFRQDTANYWEVNTAGEPLGPLLKRVANPELRGVFYKRGGSGTFSNSSFQRRYFEISWGNAVFWYGEKPGKLKNQVDLRQVKAGSQSWKSGETSNQSIQFGANIFGRSQSIKKNTKKTQDGLSTLTFEMNDGRVHEFAVPADLYGDLCAWLDVGMGDPGGKASKLL